MPKGITTEHLFTALEQLRSEIHQLERDLTRLAKRGEGVMDLLRMRDDIEVELRAREQNGQDIRAERSRMDTIDNMIRRKAPAIMHELHGLGGLEGARQQVNPPQDHWWWFVDRDVEAKRRVSIRRSLIAVAIIAVILVGGNLLLDHFYGLPPAEKEAQGYYSQGEQYLSSGNMAQAQEYLEKAVASSVPIPEAFVELGVIYQVQGRAEEGQALLDKAQPLFKDRASYLISLAQSQQAVGQLDEALTSIQEALQITPDSAQAVITRGGIYEAQGKIDLAIADYQKAGDLANDSGETALYVIARTRMGMLMQQVPMGVSPTPTGS